MFKRRQFGPQGAHSVGERRHGPRQELAEELDARMHQIFLLDAPAGPIGVLVSCAFWVLLVGDTFNRGRLFAWSFLMVVAAIIMALAFIVPRLRNSRDGFGVPNVSKFGHLLAGVGWGLMIWIDLVAARADPTLVWKATAIHMAVAAGSMSSPNGSGQLNFIVLIPLWLLAMAGAYAIGEFLVVAGFAVFVLALGRNVTPASTRIRDLVTLQLQAEQLSERDPLTGLLNRAGLDGRLQAIDLSELAVVYIDLDFFKEVNDRRGHEAGDRVLVEVATRLAGSVRSSDLVVRLGGDEFLLVVHGHDRVGDLARRVITDIERPIVVDHHVASVSASAGWAEAKKTDTLDELVRRADAALRSAKHGGRGRAVSYTAVRGNW